MMVFPLSGAAEPVQPDEIRAARRVNGWSVEDLADVLRVSPQREMGAIFADHMTGQQASTELKPAIGVRGATGMASAT
jgi:hypothetical protein